VSFEHYLRQTAAVADIAIKRKRKKGHAVKHAPSRRTFSLLYALASNFFRGKRATKLAISNTKLEGSGTEGPPPVSVTPSDKRAEYPGACVASALKKLNVKPLPLMEVKPLKNDVLYA
jgi:hypothetical protein